MKLILSALILIATALPALACNVQTYVVNGRVITCHVCPHHTVCN